MEYLPGRMRGRAAADPRLTPKKVAATDKAIAKMTITKNTLMGTRILLQ
ncbi:hypothetical protein ACUSIJ_08090 [Pseudochelatococcus sp. B33]